MITLIRRQRYLYHEGFCFSRNVLVPINPLERTQWGETLERYLYFEDLRSEGMLMLSSVVGIQSHSRAIILKTYAHCSEGLLMLSSVVGSNHRAEQLRSQL